MADELLIEPDLVTWVEALPACQAAGFKLYPWGDAPQETATRPFGLYHRVSGGRMRTTSGPSGVSYPRIQLDVIGRDYREVKRLASDIRKALEALPANSTVGGKTVQVAIVDDDMDADDADVEPQHGGELSEHRVTLDVRIWFVEA